MLESVAERIAKSRALRERLRAPVVAAAVARRVEPLTSENWDARVRDLAIATPSAPAVDFNYRPCAGCRARGFVGAGEFAYGCMRCEHTTVVIDVYGTPATKGSARAIRRGNFAVLVASGSNKNKADQRAWDTAVREAARVKLGLDRTQPLFVDRALRLDVTFRLARPAGHWSKKGTGLLPSAPPHPHHKPDRDKLLRATCDALTGLVYDDDSRPCRGETAKEWAAPGHEGATITVRAL